MNSILILSKRRWRLFLCCFVWVFLMSCQEDGQQQIQQLETALTDEELMNEPAERDALQRELALAYQEYATQYPDASESPKYMSKAAQLYKNFDLKTSLDLYENTYQNYRDYPQAAEALFAMGMIYHNDLNDQERATQTYQEFLREFPEHELAVQAEFELERLGQPDQQVAQELLKSEGNETEELLESHYLAPDSVTEEKPE